MKTIMAGESESPPEEAGFGTLMLRRSSERLFRCSYLVWEDVSVEAINVNVKNLLVNIENGSSGSRRRRKKLVDGASGFVVPHRIMAIMGPSGSGKSTLLDALAGRLSPNTMMTGNVLLNGKQRSIGTRCISYVTQEDFLLGTLTVRETLTYSAHLRLPTAMTNPDIDEAVEYTLTKMGLHDCADNKIGNWHIRGISSGEKRRLSISIELLTHPELMFLDEPTTGLDSASAFFVVQVLRNIALDGSIVVCAIHQPSSYIFDLFDDLCLLANGETVYFGEAKEGVKFFADAGFPCPTRRNPPDHFLRCINSDFDKIAATLLQSPRDCVSLESSNSQMNMSAEEIKEKLIRTYRNSKYSINTRRRICEIKLTNEQENEEHVNGWRNGRKGLWWKQMVTLTRRSTANMVRDVGYYWIRMVFICLVSVGTGVLYYDVGFSNSAFLDRVKCYLFVFIFSLCLSVGALPSFFEDWKVSTHERLNGHYGEAVFVISNLLSSSPFLVTQTMFSGTIIYYMVKFHMGFSHYAYLCIDLFCCFCIMETITMIVALLVPNFLMGIGVSAAVIVLLSLASGLYRPLPQIPKVFWRYPMSYISFTSWAVQGQFKNDMIGLEFQPMRPKEANIKGEFVLQEFLGIRWQRSKWWDIAVLLILLFCHRLLFYILLKYKERAFLVLRGVYSRRTTHSSPMTSFRLEPFSSSKSHKPPLPLSSQEGLASPLS